MLKRYKRLVRKTPIKRSTKQVNKRSAKKIAEDIIYYARRLVFLEENPRCMVGECGCTGKATDVHHKKGRGIWYLIEKFWLPVCRSCHNWIGNHSEEAFNKGYSLYRNRK